MAEYNIAVAALDDNEDDLYFIKGVLNQMGVLNYKLFNIKDDFIHNLDDNISLFILDHYLDGPMTGLDVLKIIKSKNPYSFVIFCSGADLPKDVIYEYINVGINKWVDKLKTNYLDILKDAILYGLGIASYKAEAFTYFKNKHEYDNRGLSPN